MSGTSAVLLSLRDAASYLGLAEATLRDWRVDAKGPRAIKVGRLVKYRREDLDQWIEDQAERPASSRSRRAS